MKVLRILRMITGNLIVVAVLVLGTARVLDWYNPYMDFGGHVLFMNYILAVSLAVFAGLSAYAGCLKNSL